MNPVAASLKIVDYIYFLHDGVVVAQGETSAMIGSQDPFVRQFLHAEPDGPVPFHYPSKPYPGELLRRA